VHVFDDSVLAWICEFIGFYSHYYGDSRDSLEEAGTAAAPSSSLLSSRRESAVAATAGVGDNADGNNGSGSVQCCRRRIFSSNSSSRTSIRCDEDGGVLSVDSLDDDEDIGDHHDTFHDEQLWIRLTSVHELGTRSSSSMSRDSRRVVFGGGTNNNDDSGGLCLCGSFVMATAEEIECDFNMFVSELGRRWGRSSTSE
jgi:hypothetical protein